MKNEPIIISPSWEAYLPTANILVYGAKDIA